MIEEFSQSQLHRPASRAARLNAIEQALRTHAVTSQSQLAQILAQQGIEVTQATLSRDLDEMNATKTRMTDGTVCYALPTQDSSDDIINVERMHQHMSRVLSGLVMSVASASHMVVIHTSAGAAQYVGSVLDRYEIHGILGTIAGDDTVLVICDSEQAAHERAQWLLNIASPHGADSASNETENE